MGLGAIVPAEAGVQALPESAQGAKGGAQGVAQNAAPAPIPAAPLQGGTGAGAFPAGSVLAGEVFRQSAAALQLPADSLSTALLAFSRFFSLSPSKALFTALRREALDLPKTFFSTPSTTSAATLEARAMAAAAAFDKGVTLTGEALERYARFLAPPSFPAEGDDPGQGRQDGEKETPAGGGGGGHGGQNRRDGEKAPEAEELSALAEEQAKEKKLDFLNRIPGKNGQYWAVFPFSITINGTELKIFLRLLKGEAFLSGENEQVIADIAAPKRQYRFFLKKNNKKLRADIQVYPELSPKALKSAAKKAEHFLRGAAASANVGEFEEICLRNANTPLSLAEDLSAECLPFIDEKV